MCYVQKKTIGRLGSHLFIHCSFSKMLWIKMLNVLKWNHNFSNMTALCKDMCSNNVNNRKRSITFNTIFTLNINGDFLFQTYIFIVFPLSCLIIVSIQKKKKKPFYLPSNSQIYLSVLPRPTLLLHRVYPAKSRQGNNP